MNAHVKVKDNVTYADIEALRVGVTGEIIFGALMETLSGSMDDGGPGAGTINAEPQLYLGRHAVVSDIMGWSLKRFDAPRDQHAHKTSLDGGCENVSPSTNPHDRVLESHLYAEAWLPHHRIIDPIGQTLECFEWQKSHLTKIEAKAGGDEAHAARFDAIFFSLGSIWPGEQPPSN